ncbi:MAG: PQQ-binding-like beta-propeller repeat protein, partial [Myxococcota bacterium]|nr:PQQ-binding-like beta-propeller repeat protein [Myxococcota bacterium]
MGRLIAAIALLGCLVGDSVWAVEAPTGALGPGRFIASPQGRVAWMDVSAERILLSDLSTGVAALDPERGSILWSHAATRGTLSGVWSVGDFVVLASGTVEVLDGRTGETIWRRDLFCASANRCKERAVWAGPEGVLVSGSGAQHRELQVLDLLSSNEVWLNPATVLDPGFVRLNGPAVVALDGGTPHYLRILDRATGRASKPWSWSWREKSGPDGVDIVPNGQVLVRYAEQGRKLARVAVLAESGQELDRSTIGRPDGITGVAEWGHLAEDRLWLWGPGAQGAKGWVYETRLGREEAMQSLSNVIMDKPLVLDQTVMVHQHDGRAMEISGYDAARGRRRWSHRIDAPPRHGRWHEVDRLGLLVWEGRPAPVLLVDPVRGGLVAVGEISTPGRDMIGASRSGSTLYVAVHDGVFAHRLVPLDQLRTGVLKALEERRLTDAEALYHPLALAADISDEVLEVAARLIRDTVIQARSHGRRDPASALAPFIRGLAALDRGGGRTLATWSPHLGSVLGDLFLGETARPDTLVAETLVRLTNQLASAVERVGDAFDVGGRAHSHWETLRDALVVSAAVLLQVDRGPEAAALLDVALEWTPEHTP